MKKLVLLLACLAGFQFAHADVPAHLVQTTKEFTIRSSFGAGGRVYYNCDSVESSVADMLSEMGAIRINVRCSGGIQDNFPPMDAYVRVTFTALKLAAINDRDVIKADWKRVDLHSWDDCVLKTQVFENVQSGFALSDVRRTTQCSSPSSQFRANFLALF